MRKQIEAKSCRKQHKSIFLALFCQIEKKTFFSILCKRKKKKAIRFIQIQPFKIKVFHFRIKTSSRSFFNSINYFFKIK